MGCLPFSRDGTWVSCIAGGFFTIWAMREVQYIYIYISVYIRIYVYVSVYIRIQIFPVLDFLSL